MLTIRSEFKFQKLMAKFPLMTNIITQIEIRGRLRRHAYKDRSAVGERRDRSLFQESQASASCCRSTRVADVKKKNKSQQSCIVLCCIWQVPLYRAARQWMRSLLRETAGEPGLRLFFFFRYCTGQRFIAALSHTASSSHLLHIIMSLFHHTHAASMNMLTWRCRRRAH